MTNEDIPSPIDLRRQADAEAWAADAENRPGRSEILDRLTMEAVRQGGLAPEILELGSGPGVLAERLLRAIPDARYTALDFSPAMHRLAGACLAPWADRVTFLERSFKEDFWTAGLPCYDLVVTNQAVHELRHKRHAEGLHRQVRRLLKPRGVYLVSDHLPDQAGLQLKPLFMTIDEQASALRRAGFAEVDLLLAHGSLALHRAMTGL